MNNAGVAISGPLEFIPIEELRRQLEINLVGQVAVTQAFLASLRKGRGRVVNISSIGGRVALPFVGPYAASKFGIEAVSDSLRRELRPWGIEVSVIEPGSVATPIWEKGTAKANELTEKLPPEGQELYGEGDRSDAEDRRRDRGRGIPPEDVAKDVAHALTASKPKTRYLVGRDAKMRARIAKVVPDRVFDRLIARAMGLRLDRARHRHVGADRAGAGGHEARVRALPAPDGRLPARLLQAGTEAGGVPEGGAPASR